MSKTGYCSICKRDDLKQINKMIANGQSYESIKAAIEAAPSKTTFYKHKQHSTAPLLTDADRARKNPAIAPKNNKEVLEAIRDIGLQNAIENPEKITANHAIRAASILAEKEKQRDSFVIIMAKSLQGQPPPPLLESDEVVIGEYTEENV